MDPASNAESAQNVEMFKIKKLIKGLEAARGYIEETSVMFMVVTLP